MKMIKHFLAFALFFTTCFTSFSQTDELLDALPTTKDEFINSEKKVLATINWLENTPLDQEADKRKAQNALLVAWITNSPTVTLEISAGVLTFTKKNSELLIVFMGGWTKYSLENNYSKDKIKGNLAGIQSAIKVYKKGISLKKDKEMQKLIELDEKGELEKWVTDQLAKK
jgi:hypothetical protein